MHSISISINIASHRMLQAISPLHQHLNPPLHTVHSVGKLREQNPGQGSDWNELIADAERQQHLELPPQIQAQHTNFTAQQASSLVRRHSTLQITERQGRQAPWPGTDCRLARAFPYRETTSTIQPGPYGIRDNQFTRTF